MSKLLLQCLQWLGRGARGRAPSGLVQCIQGRDVAALGSRGRQQAPRRRGLAAAARQLRVFLLLPGLLRRARLVLSCPLEPRHRARASRCDTQARRRGGGGAPLAASRLLAGCARPCEATRRRASRATLLARQSASRRAPQHAEREACGSLAPAGPPVCVRGGIGAPLPPLFTAPVHRVGTSGGTSTL